MLYIVILPYLQVTALILYKWVFSEESNVYMCIYEYGPGRVNAAIQLKGHLLANLSFFWRRSVVCSIQDFSCLDEAHPLNIIKSNLLCSEHTTLNVRLKKKEKVSLIHNTLTETFRIIFDQISRHCGSAKLIQNWQPRACMLSHFSRVWLFVTLWAVAC